MNTSSAYRNIAVFASGNGSNAENMVRYFRDSDCRVRVALIVCNKPGAGVLQRAHDLSVPSALLTRDEINNPDVLMPLLRRHKIDTVVLAGFLLMVPGFLIDSFAPRIVNLHPSLLPKFGGKGMYGRHVHQAVVDAGETETGITIHHVSRQYDEGRIIFQASVAVSPDDTPDDVERKIHALEREYFAPVVDKTLFRL